MLKKEKNEQSGLIGKYKREGIDASEILEKMGENARNFIYDHYSMKKHIEHVNSAINYLT